ncbi:acidic mammalian chitinase [Fopius arisanus]|uniref:chitinase n=1 Tax=Fopius arisanus TaxID=64838 RepID=A0A0C9QN66_9HYME|nr:PREDICTED: acidic mammalian chitinase-like [Fopius arisanus]
MRFLLFMIVYLVVSIAEASTDKKIVCYFGSWSVYRPGNGKFDISDIDPGVCTHLIYTFVGLQGEDVKVLDPWQDLPDEWGKDGFGRFNALRNTSAKTLIAIGGWNEGSAKYSQMAAKPASRERFADNVVKFVKKWGFDGFDVDWEYPGQRGGSPQDRENYIELLKSLRSRFDKAGLILSAAVAAAESSASISFNIPEICKYLDFVNIMAYDLHGAWESVTGINAPLRAASSDTTQNKKLTVEAAVKYWLEQGAPRDKLVLGMPLYGRAFTLTNPSDNAVGASARGAGAAGPYTREPGMLGYNEICEMQSQGNWNIVFDEERRVPYAVKGDQWVGYDNIKSIREKAELVKDLGLAGAMVWSIETDDFKGICGHKYPLLKTINSVLRGGTPVPEESIPPEVLEIPEVPGLPATTDPIENRPTPSRPISGSGTCTSIGNIPDPESCGYIACVPTVRGGFEEHRMQCGIGLCFNPFNGICDWLQI